jgi:hypothetical protein
MSISSQIRYQHVCERIDLDYVLASNSFREQTACDKPEVQGQNVF